MRVDFSSLVELARTRAQELADETAYMFLTNGEEEGRRLTFGELDHQARAVAARLQSVHKQGDRALLVYPSGIDYIVALFGCLYAGIAAVPLFPPNLKGRRERLMAVANDAGPRVVLTNSRIAPRLKSGAHAGTALAQMECLSTDEPGWPAEGWKPAGIGEHSLAILQYTSGSGGPAKGIALSHHHLLHNQQLIAEAFSLASRTTIVSWLPLYHDMGLIGSILFPLYTGSCCILMSPSSFIGRPVRWLRAISRYGATTSGGPNFGYEVCTRNVSEQEKEGLDLSSWRVAFNGAEPVRHDTLTRFTAAYKNCGFDSRAFYPCYGLAEATLLVSGGKTRDRHRVVCLQPGPLRRHEISAVEDGQGRSEKFVGCGQVAGGQSVLIVDPETRKACSPDRVGEIWISGPSVAAGYWSQREETAATFGATLANSSSRHYLRTGDLGFIRDGELFVTGRLKDLLVIGGQNYYPEEIEDTVAGAHPALSGRSCAAFCVPVDDNEKLVVVQEVSSPEAFVLEDLVSSVRRELGARHHLELHALALVEPGALPKTTSGKTQRRVCRQKFLEGTLQGAMEWVNKEGQEGRDASNATAENSVGSAPSSVEQTVLDIWKEILRVPWMTLDDDFFALGGNSLKAAQIAARLQEQGSVELPMEAIFEFATVSQLAKHIRERSGLRSPHSVPKLLPSGRLESYPLSFAQQRMWIAEQLYPGNPFYNIAIEATLDGELNLRALELSFREVVDRHDALRAAFPVANGVPSQVISTKPFAGITIHDLESLQAAEQKAEVSRIRDSEACRPFAFASGPWLRIVLIVLATDKHLLLLTTHHMVCDGWGVGVLIDEVNKAYRAIVAGQPAHFLPLPIQYQDYVIWQQRELSNAGPYDHQADYWRATLRGFDFLKQRLPYDSSPARNRSNRGEVVTRHLDKAISDGVRLACQQHRTTLFSFLLASLTILLYSWTQECDTVIGTAIANRNAKELEALIGCFINFVVLRNRLSPDMSGRDVLALVQRGVQAALSNGDYPFENLAQEFRLGSRDRSPLYSVGLWVHDYPVAPLLEGCLESDTRVVSTHTSELDLRVVVTDSRSGAIEIAFEYAADLFQPATMNALIKHYLEIIASLATSSESSVKSLAGAPGSSPGELQKGEQGVHLVVAASFAADPVQRYLEFWMEELRHRATVEMAPHGQLFQELLDPSGTFRCNRNGINIILIRPEDWIDSADSTTGAARRKPADARQIQAVLTEFLEALEFNQRGHQRVTFLCLCPWREDDYASAAERQIWTDAREKLMALSRSGNFEAIDLSGYLPLYKAADVYDAYASQLAGIPYTDEFFAVAAGVLARKISAHGVPARKVIVVDCDETLWKGICGEDGWKGVRINAHHAELQNLLLEQKRKGFLLCLCSRNNPDDVFEVFRNRNDMILKLEDMVSHRINWLSKKDNLVALSKELGLDLNSFIFVDDDPVICSEVREYCPEVLTLEASPEVGDIAHCCRHLWAFEITGETAEDRQRTSLYRQNRLREDARKSSMSLDSFMASLGLEVSITPLREEHVDRMAQLTQRINQFNFTQIRRTASEVRQLLASNQHQCRVVHARDRFGDYGLIGVLVFTIEDGVVAVETFLLSCRALGKRIEQTMLSHLLALGEFHGCSDIQVGLTVTNKNMPACEFLTRVFWPQAVQPGLNYSFRSPIVDVRNRLLAKKEELPVQMDDSIFATDGPTPSVRTGQVPAHIIARTAMKLNTAAKVMEVFHDKRRSKRVQPVEYAEPRSPIERTLARIWSEALGLDRIGVHDNFFRCGGQSLMAVQILSRTCRELGVELGIEELFYNPTIAGCSDVIVKKVLETSTAAELQPILETVRKLDSSEVISVLKKETGPQGEQ